MPGRILRHLGHDGWAASDGDADSVPDGADALDRTGEGVEGRALGTRVAHRDLPRRHHDRHRSVGRVGAEDLVASDEGHLGEVAATPPRTREVVHAGERRDERRRRRLEEFGRRALLDDGSRFQHRDPRRQTDHVFEIVRDEDRGKSDRAQLPGQLPGHVALRQRVQRRERFVQQQDVGIGGDGPG